MTSIRREPQRPRTATRRKAVRWTSSFGGALATVALVASPPAQAATVLTIAPLSLGQGPIINAQLGGALCAAPNTCTAVDYPASLAAASIPSGAAALSSLIGSTTKPVVVFGYSEGAQVASMWMAQYGDRPNAPAAQDVSFVLIGNPNRAYGGKSNALAKLLNIATPSDTQYQVTEVAREYDFWADFPTGQLNPIAMVNAVAGSLFIHTDYTKVDLTDPNNVTWKEGNITYVLVPTATLPMFLPLKWVGLGSLADSLSAQYRPIVDSAYDRPVPVQAQTANTTAATQPATTVTAASKAATTATAASKAATGQRPAVADTAAVPTSARAAKVPTSAPANSRPTAESGRDSSAVSAAASSAPASPRSKAKTAESRSGGRATPSAASKPSPR